MTLQTTLAAIRPADPAAMAAARELQARLTKPAGSLGELEDLSVRLAGLAGRCPPPLPEPAALAVFAGDHGVHAQRVTPWPQEVTAQMVANMLTGGAVVNAFARQVGASVTVVDVGVAVPPVPPAAAVPAVLVEANVRRGTRDMTVEPAMTRAEAVAAVEVGIRVADDLVDAGAAALLTGDMGIANTTPSAALIAAFTGADPAAVTGRGTGVDDETYARKVAVVTAALARHGLAGGADAAGGPVGGGAAGVPVGGPVGGGAAGVPVGGPVGGGAVGGVPVGGAGGGPVGRDPVEVLAAVGGLEHAALAGLILGAAARRVPVIIDGVIAVSAALVAAAFAPDAVAAMVAGHRSVEPGATVALAHLGLTPLLDLGLRLGEGSGAVLALPVVAAAARVLHEVATFDSAGVSEK